MDNHPLDPLAIERTGLALERTHLAWIRTVIALIASGFAIDELVEVLRQDRLLRGKAVVMQAHITGLVLTIAGDVLLLLVTAYYIKRGRQLARLQQEGYKRMLPGTMLSVFVFLAGLVIIYLAIVS